MGKITAIENQKRSGRVNIFVDDKFCVGIKKELIVDHNLFKGKEITKKEIEELKKAEVASKCLASAYRLLSIRPRSEKEMKEKLLCKFSSQEVNKVIKKLKEYDYIDDVKFSQMWIAQRRGSHSKKALRFELAKKGISREIVEEELKKINQEEEQEAAKNLIRKKTKYQNLNKEEAYKKIGGFLMRRGFDYQIIKNILNEYK